MKTGSLHPREGKDEWFLPPGLIYSKRGSSISSGTLTFLSTIIKLHGLVREAFKIQKQYYMGNHPKPPPFFVWEIFKIVWKVDEHAHRWTHTHRWMNTHNIELLCKFEKKLCGLVLEQTNNHHYSSLTWVELRVENNEGMLKLNLLIISLKCYLQ